MKAACAIVICTSFLGSGLAIGGRVASGTIPGAHARLAVPYADVQRLLDAVRDQYSVVPRADFNRFQNSFGHIFAGGYDGPGTHQYPNIPAGRRPGLPQQ